MFKIFICKKDNTNIGEWIDLPNDNITLLDGILNVTLEDWIITKCIHDELNIHLEKYQNKSSYENLRSINLLAKDYESLNQTEKEMIKSLSKDGKDFEELVSEIIDEKIRKVAQNSLDMIDEMSEEDAEEYCKNLLSIMFR